MSAHHVLPEKLYYQIFAALMILLVMTVAAAEVDLGPFNLVVALTIAVVKAVLVILFFMHVRYGSRLTWLFAGAAFFWVVILMALTFNDYNTRDWLPRGAAWDRPVLMIEGAKEAVPPKMGESPADKAAGD